MPCNLQFSRLCASHRSLVFTCMRDLYCNRYPLVPTNTRALPGSVGVCCGTCFARHFILGARRQVVPTSASNLGVLSTSGNAVAGMSQAQLVTSLRSLSQPRADATSQYVVHTDPVAAFNQSQEYISNALQEAQLDLQQFCPNLEVWQGPLDGLAHRRGQFSVLMSDTAAPVSDTQLLQGLLGDIQFLCRLRDLTKHILYYSMASETEYAMLPVILEAPAISTCTTKSVSASASRTSATLDAASMLQVLGVGTTVAATFQKPLTFATKEEFAQHVKSQQVRPKEEELADVPPNLATSAQKTKEAFEELTEYAQPPFFQVVLGNDGMYNPVPVFWLAKSPHGNLLGLMSAVVWT